MLIVKDYDENMYLDAATRTKVEETGGANFIFVTKDNKVVTPKSNSILPSITRRSLIYVAKEYLGLEVEEREVYLRRSKRFCRMWSLRYCSSYFSCWKDRMTTAKRSVSQAEWKKWDRSQRSFTRH